MTRDALKGFIAGVVSTLVFHQTLIWLLAQVLPFPFKPWNLAINRYGVPTVAALAFWAGVWGIVLCLLLVARPALRPMPTGIVFGALLPSLWSWTVIATMRGTPLFAGGAPKSIAVGLLVNGVWGAGTVWLFGRMRHRQAALT